MRVCWDLSLSAGQSGMGLSLAVVVRLPQRYGACCFIGQDKLLRQGFCWRYDFCQSQTELHNTFTLQVLCRFPSKALEQRIMHGEAVFSCFSKLDLKKCCFLSFKKTHRNVKLSRICRLFGQVSGSSRCSSRRVTRLQIQRAPQTFR